MASVRPRSGVACNCNHTLNKLGSPLPIALTCPERRPIGLPTGTYRVKNGRSADRSGGQAIRCHCLRQRGSAFQGRLVAYIVLPVCRIHGHPARHRRLPGQTAFGCSGRRGTADGRRLRICSDAASGRQAGGSSRRDGRRQGHQAHNRCSPAVRCSVLPGRSLPAKRSDHHHFKSVEIVPSSTGGSYCQRCSGRH